MVWVTRSAVPIGSEGPMVVRRVRPVLSGISPGRWVFPRNAPRGGLPEPVEPGPENFRWDQSALDDESALLEVAHVSCRQHRVVGLRHSIGAVLGW